MSLLVSEEISYLSTDLIIDKKGEGISEITYHSLFLSQLLPESGRPGFSLE